MPVGVKSRSVSINGDGTLVAAGFDDYNVRVWRVGDGELIATFAGHNNHVAQIAFGPLDKSSSLASVASGSLQVWGFDGGSDPKQSFEADSPTVAFNPDGSTIATGGGAATLWKLEDGSKSNLPSESWVTAVAYNATGDLLAWADAGVHLNVVDRAGTTVLRVENAHTQPITRIAFRGDGAQVATASEDGTVKLWRVNSPAPANLTLTKQHELYRQAPIRAVAFSPNGTLVAIGADGASLWRPDLDINAYMNPTGTAFDVTFSPDGNALAVGDSSTVAIYDVSASTLEDGTANAPLLRKCEGASDHITAIAYDQDGSTLVASSEDGSLHVWDATDCADRTPSNFKQEVIGGQTLRDVAFTDGGERVVAGGSGQTNIWSVTGTPIANQPDQPFALAVDGNTDTIALGTHSLILRDHDLDEIRKTGEGGEIYALAYSTAGDMLAAGYYDGKIRLWRPGDLALLAEIEAHEGKVTGLAFSPDGTQLVSGGEDKIAKLWQVVKP
jgi:WD40 repeat protein